MKRSRSRSPYDPPSAGHVIVSDVRGNVVDLFAENEELRRKNAELERTNIELLTKVRRLEKLVSQVGKRIDKYRSGVDDSSDSDVGDVFAIEDCAGSDTEAKPHETCTPRLLQLHDVGGLGPAFANVTFPPPALEDGCASPLREYDMGLDDVAREINRCKKSVLVICGAGISTSCGIKDFRSPGTGLYSTLDSAVLPSPEALFSIDYFKENPEPFYSWALENWPGGRRPSTTHYFLKLLLEKCKLLRCYTQNIDGLERVAGLDRRLVEAHGNFKNAHVVKDAENDDSRKTVNISTLKKALENKTWQRLRNKHRGLVKPNIVFFEESFPLSFTQYWDHDVKEAELLLVIGTSMSIRWTREMAVRCKARRKILINLGEVDPEANECDWHLWSKMSCDDACEELAMHLGWTQELKLLRSSVGRRIS